jgi:hypothetical protein
MRDGQTGTYESTSDDIAACSLIESPYLSNGGEMSKVDSTDAKTAKRDRLAIDMPGQILSIII